MNRQHFGIGIVLSLVVLSAAIMAARPPGTEIDEQAGSLAALAEVPRRAQDPLDQQARMLHEQLKSRLATGTEPTKREAELKQALDRYFAGSKIEQAIELLEQIISEAEGTPEANKASAAIQLLKGSGAGGQFREEKLESNLGDFPTPIRPTPKATKKPAKTFEPGH